MAFRVFLYTYCEFCLLIKKFFELNQCIHLFPGCFCREKDLTAKCIIQMEGTKTSISNLKVTPMPLLLHTLTHLLTATHTKSFCLDSRRLVRRLGEGAGQNLHLRLLLWFHGLQELRLHLPGEGQWSELLHFHFERRHTYTLLSGLCRSLTGLLIQLHLKQKADITGEGRDMTPHICFFCYVCRCSKIWELTCWRQPLRATTPAFSPMARLAQESPTPWWGVQWVLTLLPPPLMVFEWYFWWESD